MNNEMDRSRTPEEGGTDDVLPQEPVAPAISPGNALAKRREELNLSVQQVAGQLNLAPRQVRAIEEDNFDALPGIAIARGFVRSYAKLLKIDAEPLLAAMAPAVAPMPDARPLKQTYVSKPLTGDRLTFSERTTKSSKTVRILLGIVVAGIAVAGALQFGALSMGPGGSEVQTPADAATPPQPAVPDGQAVEVLPSPAVPAEPSPAPDAVPESSTPSPVQPVAMPVNLQTKSVPSEDKNALVLNVREQSWIEIKRADGTILAARLFEAGTEESIPLTAELSLVVGNASGVEASLRGEQLNLQTKARGNVARITVR